MQQQMMMQPDLNQLQMDPNFQALTPEQQQEYINQLQMQQQQMPQFVDENGVPIDMNALTPEQRQEYEQQFLYQQVSKQPIVFILCSNYNNSKCTISSSLLGKMVSH